MTVSGVKASCVIRNRTKRIMLRKSCAHVTRNLPRDRPDARPRAASGGGTSHFYEVATLVAHSGRWVGWSPALFTHLGGSEVGRSPPHSAHSV